MIFQDHRWILGFNPCFSGWRSESWIPISRRIISRGFNPCFSGWRSESFRTPREGGSYNRVSILVFLDDALKAHIHWLRESRSIVSILVFLDDALKDTHGGSWLHPLLVSILVFLDDALKDHTCDLVYHGIQFQSLFFWMTLWKSPKVPLLELPGCFNPCFSGWRSESPHFFTVFDEKMPNRKWICNGIMLVEKLWNSI